MIENYQQSRLNKLCLNYRALNLHKRLFRENRCALRHSPNITGKFEISHIVEKFLVKEVFASEILDVIVVKA